MPVNQITPTQAKSILDEDADSIYLDVRSIPEFVAGHPIRAINIPLLHFSNGQMTPNPDFAKVAEKVLPKGKRLVVGCKSGGRSQQACQILSQTGFTDLSNVQGGFGGSPTQKGWKDLGLPVSQENGEGVGYETLLITCSP